MFLTTVAYGKPDWLEFMLQAQLISLTHFHASYAVFSLTVLLFFAFFLMLFPRDNSSLSLQTGRGHAYWNVDISSRPYLFYITSKNLSEENLKQEISPQTLCRISFFYLLWLCLSLSVIFCPLFYVENKAFHIPFYLPQ